MIYKIVEICYDIDNEHHWYVKRTGTIAEQGGFTTGVEGSYHETLNDALEWLEFTMRDEEDVIKDLIMKKENNVKT